MLKKEYEINYNKVINLNKTIDDLVKELNSLKQEKDYHISRINQFDIELRQAKNTIEAQRGEILNYQNNINIVNGTNEDLKNKIVKFLSLLKKNCSKKILFVGIKKIVM